MNIYRITDSESEDFQINQPDKIQDNLTVKLLEVPVLKTLGTGTTMNVDYDYMNLKYNIRISDEEILMFATHCEIWESFLQSGEEFCLIMEDNVKCLIDIKKIYEEISAFEQKDWDVFFPFEKQGDPKRYDDKPYILGYYWGSCIYFISRSGANKLKDIKTIKQPIDDELLSSGFIELYAEDTQWFEIDFDRAFSHTGRIREIGRAMEEYDVWSKSNKLLVREILKIVSEISIRINVKLILHAGSLLGAIRHNEIIPWDDDVDLAIERKSFQSLEEAIIKDNRLQISVLIEDKTNVKYYKLWLKTGEAIENHPYTFPFVDIWLYIEKNSDIIFDDGTVFPNIDKFGFETILFEGSMLNIPGNYSDCLDALYDDWKIKFTIYAWSHRLEKLNNKAFVVDILTSQDGKFLDYSPV